LREIIRVLHKRHDLDEHELREAVFQSSLVVDTDLLLVPEARARAFAPSEIDTVVLGLSASVRKELSVLAFLGAELAFEAYSACTGVNI
jgi:hypothetical protein